LSIQDLSPHRLNDWLGRQILLAPIEVPVGEALRSGTEFAETDLVDPFRQAASYCLKHHDEPSLRLVHGRVRDPISGQEIAEAWAEMTVDDSILVYCGLTRLFYHLNLYYHLMDATPKGSYTVRFLAPLAKPFGHFDPWDLNEAGPLGGGVVPHSVGSGGSSPPSR
jgi:hypothetical protein